MKGKPEVIEVLNDALRHELTAVNQYWLHYRILDNWGFKKLAAHERKESIEEMQHADKLVERILFLEGHPNMQKLDPLKIGESLKEVLECDLKAEISARTLYIKARAICRTAEDLGTMALFEQLIHDEEGHIDFLETQLDLMKQIGVENYGLLQSESADKAEG
ncbi:MAG: bacterioferritin [Hyphomicrobium sp.]